MGSAMTVGQLTTPRFPTTCPFTIQRCTGRSKATAMCALSVVSARCGMASPHLAFDIRLVKASLSGCACESQLIRPYLISIPLLPRWFQVCLICRSEEYTHSLPPLQVTVARGGKSQRPAEIEYALVRGKLT